MGNIKLFEVTDSWYVKGRGLVLVYDSPLASLAVQKNLRDTIVVAQPGQTRSEYDAVVEVAHFSMEDGPGKFAFVVTLPDATPGSIRRGSQVFGSAAAATMLLGKDL